MCPSLIEMGSKTAEKNSAQTHRQTDRHYENNGHLAVNQNYQLESQVASTGNRLSLVLATVYRLMNEPIAYNKILLITTLDCNIYRAFSKILFSFVKKHCVNKAVNTALSLAQLTLGSQWTHSSMNVRNRMIVKFSLLRPRRSTTYVD